MELFTHRAFSGVRRSAHHKARKCHCTQADLSSPWIYKDPRYRTETSGCDICYLSTALFNDQRLFITTTGCMQYSLSTHVLPLYDHRHCQRSRSIGNLHRWCNLSRKGWLLSRRAYCKGAINTKFVPQYHEKVTNHDGPQWDKRVI